eukprot:CAMPEP_0201476408 /NCGR_PEP_ID=MMETSP0151_2-20130828/1606_1 /ASSEMBLY_ACC=CAM_ASM_000257 /TAXON_ID=200890 /ORGANISM="Paramoeba atlantica, Strain 621/1 / CCAP 1560/9" /LENGTH=350 /DNA_ID=CAMNT_0047856757 /DNA_START=88 /DNA_END=1136 /DNA_ORIENTATION=+
MAALLEGATDLDKLHSLCKKTHKEQTVWFLNAFWDDFASQHAEALWVFVEHAVKIDNAKETGNELDEMEAHRFLEKADEAHTVLEMRALLRKTGAIGQSERPKAVPLSHYYLFKFHSQSAKLFHELVTRGQGDNSKQIEEAQAKLDAVSAAFDEASRAANAADASLREAQSNEAAAKKAEAEAIASAEAATIREKEAKKSAETLAVREEELRASQAELEAALAELKKQEAAYNAKTESLKKKSEEGGVVSRNKAKNELAQHLAEDPLPLRQAKISSEAAVRKAEKMTTAAKEARVKADSDAVAASEARAHAEADAKASQAARSAAEQSRAIAEKDKEAADAAVDAAQAAV